MAMAMAGFVTATMTSTAKKVVVVVAVVAVVAVVSVVVNPASSSR